MRDFKLCVLIVKKDYRQLIHVPESVQTPEFFDTLSMTNQ